jgi:anti-sigma regulatory factor (Ser/Thr protein kinase)
VRAWVRITLTAQGYEDALESAELIMSELATNANRHATQSDIIKIVCELDAYTLTLGVIDYDPRQPIQRTAHEDDENGRGLTVVNALCDEWGCP